MTTTAQTIAEFIIASALHYGPGPHPDGSYQQVHAGGATPRPGMAPAPRAAQPAPAPPAASTAARPAPRARPAAPAPTFTISWPADRVAGDQLPPTPALPRPLQRAEDARQRLLTTATEIEAQRAQLRQQIDAAVARQNDTPLPPGENWQTSQHPNAIAKRAANAEFTSLLKQDDKLRKQANKLGAQINPVAAREGGGVAVAAVDATLKPAQRKQLNAGAQKFNVLVKTNWRGTRSGDPPVPPVRFAPVEDPRENRAYYARDTVYVTKSSGEIATVHELGHHLEMSMPRLGAYARQFVSQRSAGAAARPLRELVPNAGYAADEHAHADKFIDPYVGKVYGGGATEAISMGLEYMARDPVAFARKDPEHFRFTYTVMHDTWRDVP